MKKPITHSEFTKFIIGATIDGNPLPSAFTREIISLTAGGVAPEAGLWPTDESNVVFHEGAPKPKPSRFQFGAGSVKEMIGVDTRLIQVARIALSLSPQDFTFFDGVRTVKEQEALLKKGATKTMQSKHIEGLAMDLVPFKNGKPVWEWKLIYHVVMAVDQAATQLGYAHLITWGGAWDRRLSDFGGDAATSYLDVVQEYCKRHPGKDFIDGPHFQIEGPRQ